FAANTVLQTTTGPGAGFTSRVITVPDSDIVEDRLVTAPGSYTATAPVTPSSGWIMQMVAFKAAPSVPDTQPPTAPTNLTATGGIGTVSLTWTASTDNVGVASYTVYRSTTSGFTPSAANQIGTTTATSFNNSGLAVGTYFYLVQAADAAGNVSSPSNEATATTTTDTTPPSAPSNLTATAASSSQINLNWTAST